MAITDIDGTTKNMFGISVAGSRIDVRSNNGVVEVRNHRGVWRKVQTAVYMGAAIPTINDDDTLGYLETDLWFFDTSLYLCTDNTTGAAVWIQIAGGSKFDDIVVAVDSSIVVSNSGNVVVRS